MWTLVTVVVLLLIWAALWRSQPKLAFGVLLGLPVAWVASRLIEPYLTGTAQLPVWVPPLPFAAVATTLLVFGAIVWLKADNLPPPLVRDTHGHGHGQRHGHEPAAPAAARPEVAAEAGNVKAALPDDDLAAALELMRIFVGRRISAQEFATEYKVVWRRLRDTERLATLDPYMHRALNAVLDTIESIERTGGSKAIGTNARELGVSVTTVLNVIDQAA